jgi:hypothetical protein
MLHDIEEGDGEDEQGHQFYDLGPASLAPLAQANGEDDHCGGDDEQEQRGHTLESTRISARLSNKVGMFGWGLSQEKRQGSTWSRMRRHSGTFPELSRCRRGQSLRFGHRLTLPVSPDQQTISDPFRTSRSGQEATSPGQKFGAADGCWRPVPPLTDPSLGPLTSDTQRAASCSRGVRIASFAMVGPVAKFATWAGSTATRCPSANRIRSPS